MSLPIDSQTPLVLRSEIRNRINADPTKSDVANRLLNLIIEVGQMFQSACGRRFDEYMETRYYTPLHVSQGGDLYGLRELRLDADLKSFATITNGDASTINPTLVTLLPINSAYKSTIRLNPYGIQFWYHAGVTDPIGSVAVAGTWGYGGQWLATGATLATALPDGSGTTLLSSATLEDGMVLMIDSEYLYISAFVGTSNTVVRGFNGSTGAAHLVNAPIYRWLPNKAVQQCVTRLVQMALEQDKSPLFGQLVVGDIAIPVQVDSWPKDVISTVRLSGLKRPPRIQGI